MSDMYEQDVYCYVMDAFFYQENQENCGFTTLAEHNLLSRDITVCKNHEKKL